MMKLMNFNKLLLVIGTDGQKGEAGNQGATGMQGPPGPRGLNGKMIFKMNFKVKLSHNLLT